jgi:hypothetical protein
MIQSIQDEDFDSAEVEFERMIERAWYAISPMIIYLEEYNDGLERDMVSAIRTGSGRRVRVEETDDIPDLDEDQFDTWRFFNV